MSTGLLAAAVQVALMVVGGPLLVGLMRQVRAGLEGRAGAGIRQPWRDLRKLMRKQPIRPVGTGPVFRAAPVIQLGTVCVAAAVVPLAGLVSPLDSWMDLFV